MSYTPCPGIRLAMRAFPGASPSESVLSSGARHPQVVVLERRRSEASVDQLRVLREHGHAAKAEEENAVPLRLERDAALDYPADALEDLRRRAGEVGDGLLANALVFASGSSEQNGEWAAVVGNLLDGTEHGGIAWRQRSCSPARVGINVGATGRSVRVRGARSSGWPTCRETARSGYRGSPCRHRAIASRAATSQDLEFRTGPTGEQPSTPMTARNACRTTSLRPGIYNGVQIMTRGSVTPIARADSRRVQVVLSVTESALRRNRKIQTILGRGFGSRLNWCAMG